MLKVIAVRPIWVKKLDKPYIFRIIYSKRRFCKNQIFFSAHISLKTSILSWAVWGVFPKRNRINGEKNLLHSKNCENATNIQELLTIMVSCLQMLDYQRGYTRSDFRFFIPRPTPGNSIISR